MVDQPFIDELDALREKLRAAGSLDELRQAVSMVVSLMLDFAKDHAEGRHKTKRTRPRGEGQWKSA
jgi:hypothetical protein